MTLVIYGPTTTGKTALAIKLAKKFNGELISADSRQVYQGMDIGSGKVSFDAQVQKKKEYWIVDGVKIHGFDIKQPGQQFTVADFVKFANTTTKKILKQRKLPIIVGGTGFYIKSLLISPESFGIPQNSKLRKKLESQTAEKLFNLLLQLDQKKANSLNKSDRKNPRRLTRAIEIAKFQKGKKITKTNEKKKDYFVVCLSAPNQTIYKKSDKWLEIRLQNGLEDEIKTLLQNNVNPKWLEGLGLEYKWITRLVQGKVTKDEAIERLKGETHDFIRRQKTWFSKLDSPMLIDITENSYQQKIEGKIKGLIALYRKADIYSKSGGI